MLKHQTSTIAVFVTDQYKNFSMITGNREINIQKANRIIKEIEAGNDMLQYYPIQVRVVKEKLEILDGQHRFFICKKLKRPVHYILISEDKTMADIARVNSNVEKWHNKNFINCYILVGNKNYRQVQKFIELYGFTVGISLCLLTNGTPGTESGSGTRELFQFFQEGKFEVKAWDAAVAFAETCKQFSAFRNWRSRAFIIAIYKIQHAGMVGIDKVLEAFNKHPDMLTEQANKKEYILLLEKIMNVGKSKRIVIT